MYATTDKEGPIYATEWSPDGKEFVAVYGFMPAKAMLFGENCKPLMNFGTGPRNSVKFNPQGGVICLAGFGNLRGEMVCDAPACYWPSKWKERCIDVTALLYT